ncbi:alpha-mannosidase [Paenibacillus sp.]|uniref:alpha-mannosidase n=1 Tax=Paenibacillus sp. TaxID=58172 RepID=UPI002D6EC853|nr:alpha-mannosidase [Paenibacillus sp.]HZG57133.1 alpha-mannosidase [Paenibacillus sp.]
MSMWLTEEKLGRRIEELKSAIYREVQEIPSFLYIEGDFDEMQQVPDDWRRPEFDDSGWKPFQVGSTWGGYDKTAYFRAKVAIPERWRGERLALRFLVGPRDGGGSTAETLLYVDGAPLQAIDIWHEDAWLPPELAAKGEIHIALKAWSSVLKVPDVRRFKVAQLVVVDRPAEKLYFMADTLLKAVKELPETDLHRSVILQSINRAVQTVDFMKPRSKTYYESIAAAAEGLAADIESWKQPGARKPKVIGFGHSHIDMAWLWRLAHSREKASRTFSTVLHLMRQYPEYRFLHTSPQLYKFLKQDYPEIYAQVKERIASGEWEITGGMWIEPDMNVPNGESLVRQILFGKRFIREEFGQKTNVVFLPDVFGYNWALPQIIKRSGIDYFITSKISWNQYNRFPHDTFMWRGVDGTEIMTHYITTPEDGSGKSYTYNGLVRPYEVKGTWDQYKQKDVNEELIMAFGWGDGGGGPTKDFLEAAEVLKDVPGLPRFELGKMEPYLERLGERVKPSALPVWDGELYLEYHRGTYTSQAWLKRANRKAELLYHAAEWLSAYADVLTGGRNYPQASLNEGWEMLLLSQFHDILPGSSIRQVYEDTRKEFETIERIGGEALRAAETAVAARVRTERDGLLVWNALGWERDGLLELDWTPELEGRALEGAATPATQRTTTRDGRDALLVKAPKVPSLGYLAAAFVPAASANAANAADAAGERALKIAPEALENAFYAIRLNAQGQIASIYDKRARREVLAEGELGNVLQAFEDKPINFDAWDIDLFYQEKMTVVDDLVEAVVEEEGPLRGTLRLVWRFLDSTITQRLTLYADDPRIDFRTDIDWREKQVLLKVAFPVAVRSTKATYDIQFGNIERATHWNTSWDYAKFEVAAQKWADLSEGNYGVALLNDCKYGYDIKGHVMRLTLLKSPIEPDETADRGHHAFTYALLPHAGGWREADVARAAYELNAPLSATPVAGNPQGALPAAGGFATLECEHAMLETVKKAEDDDAIVVRVYEYKQYRTSEAAIVFDRPIRKAVECNLVEEEEGAAAFAGERLTFGLKPYEIKTFKVWF